MWFAYTVVTHYFCTGILKPPSGPTLPQSMTWGHKWQAGHEYSQFKEYLNLVIAQENLNCLEIL